MFCKHCGKPIPEIAFCKYCGKPTGLAGFSRSAGSTFVPVMSPLVLPAAKKSMVKSVSIFLVFILLLGGAGYFFINYYLFTPEKTINNFVTAYNDLDIDAMVDCCEPKLQKIYKAGVGAAGSIAGFNANEILNGAGAFSSIVLGDKNAKISIEILSINYPIKNIAEVETNFIFTPAAYMNGYSETQQQQTIEILTLKRINYKWYMGSESFFTIAN